MNTTDGRVASRRIFLKSFWSIAVVSSLNGMPWSAKVLSKITSGKGIVHLRVSDYPILSAAGGSMQFNAGPLPPIMINRGESDVFHAMSVVCQHQGCFVPVYDHERGFIKCGCHGSQYAIDGSLIAGPALRELGRFATSFDGNNTLKVLVPELAFDAMITSVKPTGGSTARLALVFPAAAFSDYCVYQHDTLSGERDVIPVAITQDGSASHLAVRPTSTGNFTVYIDASGNSGFYSVALIMKAYQN